MNKMKAEQQERDEETKKMLKELEDKRRETTAEIESVREYLEISLKKLTTTSQI